MIVHRRFRAPTWNARADAQEGPEGADKLPGIWIDRVRQEGKNAVKWTKLSCHDFVDNQVRLQLFALAYNLGNFLRQLALPPAVKPWTPQARRNSPT
jgi:hypothetical protein